MSEELTPMDRMELWMSAINEAIANGTENTYTPYDRHELWMKKICESILAKDPADPDVVQQFVEDWLDDHPEATTTVQDGAVTTAKIADGAVTAAKLDESATDIVADTFSTSTAYSVGDYCIYSGALYRFAADKSAGAWDSTKVTAVALADDVSEIEDILQHQLQTDTKTGDIAKFEYCKDEAPICIEMDMLPLQSGENAPSPTNIRGITGYTSFKAYASNRNLFEGTVENRAFSSGKVIASTNYRCIYQKVVGGKTYVISRSAIESNRFQVTSTKNVPVANEPIDLNYVAGNDAYNLVYTVPEGYNYIFVYLSNASDTITPSNYQIELGTEAHSIDAHQGDSVSQNYGSTVYGGHLSYDGRDQISVVKNKVAVTFDGSENWVKSGQEQNGTYFYLTTSLPFKKFANAAAFANVYAIANEFAKSETAVSSTSGANTFWWNAAATGFRVIYNAGAESSLADFKAFLTAHPLTVVAEAESPETITVSAGDFRTSAGLNIIYVDGQSATMTVIKDLQQEIDDLDFSRSIYELSNNNFLGNVSIRAAKTVNFNDGTQPIIEWYLLQDIGQNFYMSKDLKSKQFIFNFVPNKGGIGDWSFGIDANNNIIAIIQAAALTTANNLDDNTRTVNPVCWLASEEYKTEHEIDFGSSFKPVGWLGNYGWCILPNKDILFCEYTRPKVATCNVWKISHSNILDKNNWSKVWSHAIVQTSDTTGMKHCHCIQYDFFTGVVYLGTGDSDAGSYIYHSEDNGANWSLTYGPNKKRCRMLTFVFTKDYVYWASDSYESEYHSFFKAERTNDIIDVENATETALGAVNKQACYGCVYLQDENLIVMMDRNDTTVPDNWTFILSGYDMESNQIVELGRIKPLGENAGFRTLFVDWYPKDNHILIGFDPVNGQTGTSTNMNAVCGNLGGTTGNGSTRINNLMMSVYKHSSNFSIRFDTLFV